MGPAVATLRRRGLLAGAVAVVVVAVAALLTTVWRSEGTSVSTGSGGPGEYARILRLDEGRAGHVAVEYSGGVRVWWRGPGEGDWSAPEVVDGGDDRYLLSANVRVVGTTLAVRAYYASVPPWEDEPQGRNVPSSVFVACEPGSCVASQHYERVPDPPCRKGSCRLRGPEGKVESQAPQLSGDGQVVLFGPTDEGYVAWTPQDGMLELAPTGLPSDEVLGAPLLANDGSLRLVSGSEDRGSCRLTLHTSPPLEGSGDRVTFTPEVTTAVPTETGVCATTLEAFAVDHLVVHTDRQEPAYFVRRAGAWRPASADPTGMVRYEPRPGRQAAGSVVRTGFWHWREVVTASPDGRRLVAQVHFPGEPRWSEPQVVARAPRGLDCFEIAPTSTPADEPFYVSMRCRSRPTPGSDWEYVGVHAVTEDGVTWRSAVGDHLPTRVGEELWFGGSPAYRWTPGEGLLQEGLPIPANSSTFLVTDGTRILVTAVPGDGRCRLEIRVAEPTEDEWSTPLTTDGPLIPRADPCRPIGQSEGALVRLYPDSYDPEWLPAAVERRDDAWVVRPPRRAG